MGILALIQGEKNKFKNNASKEEVNNARKGFVQGDVEVYDSHKKTVGEMIAGAKAKFKTTKARIEMAQQEHIQKQNVKLKSEYENLQLKNKVNKEKLKLSELRNKKISKGLRMVTGGANIPTATQPGRGIGQDPFPKNTEEKKSQEGRNALGGVDPFQ
jgi:multidrug efflux pump subunit AcrB